MMPLDSETNLVALFHQRALKYSDRSVLLFKHGATYKSVAWREWQKMVIRCALGLYHLGVRSGDRIAILSENRPEWTFADFGTLSLGGALVPIYATSGTHDVEYILHHAKCSFLFISNPAQLDKIKNLWDKLPFLKGVILFEGDEGFIPNRPVYSFKQILEFGKMLELSQSGLYEKITSAIRPDDVATIIYTSGTTGPPKGVMLTHRNFVCNYLGAQKAIRVSSDDIALSFLPLSHVFERLAGYYFMVFSGAKIAYAESMQTVPEDMKLVRPTVAAAVPRFYEKVLSKVLERIAVLPPILRRLFEQLLQSGHEFAQRKMRYETISIGLRLRYAFAKLLIFNNVKKGLGGRIRFFISGGAPLNPVLAEFFYASGMLILEGYGLTETSPVITVNRENEYKIGTVGKVIENVAVRIAEDGEILTQGPCVMKGYFEDDQATRLAIRDGWFHTGDIGVIDDQGFLKITDRIKDIIVTSGGKNVSPQNIEKLLLQEPLISQVVVLGDKRNYLVALIVPKPDKIKAIAASLGLKDRTYESLLTEASVIEQVGLLIHRRISHLANYEQIKYFRLVEREFTLAEGDLTPTLKIKRKAVSEKYKSLIDAMYAQGASHQSRDR